ncbi:MAG TPA: DUF2726 domain-containing protein [Burkholderiaceae bacterium]|jgi:hypothetical protein|nr:DUF2726 domain-containing protein [Burkholderiaceae bacterium]
MTTPVLALIGVLCLVLVWWWLRHRATGGTKQNARPEDALDTVAAWPPEPARVLTTPEARAYQLLVRNLPPGYAVLAQVPLSRFLRVPTRHSYREWMRRVGRLNADLVVCDSTFQVLSVVSVRPEPGKDSERGVERHARMDRVLRKARIRVLNWHEGTLPKAELVPDLVFGRSGPVPAFEPPAIAATAGAPAQARESEPPEADAAAAEPLPSTFFDDLDSRPVPLPRPKARE